MAYYEMMPAGLPAGLQAGMDSVLNKKFGTSTSYAPGTWPDTVNLMGPLPEEIASGSIVTFTDGADDVPLKSCEVALPPSLDGYSSVDVVNAGKNLSSVSEYPDNPWNFWGTNFTDMVSILNTLKIGTYTISFDFEVETVPDSGDIQYGLPYIRALVGGSYVNLTSYSISAASSVSVGDIFRVSASFTLTDERVGNVSNVYIYCDRKDNHSGTGRGSYNLINAQVEVGSTASSYSHYVAPTTHTANLGRTIYGGTPDVVNGEGEEAYGKKVFDGTEGTGGTPSWTMIFVTQGTMFRITVSDKATTSATNTLCSYYTPVAQAQRADGTVSGAGTNVDIIDNRFSSVDDFKAWLSENPVVLVYELATPTNFTFSPVEINSRLGNNTMWSDGDMSVVYRRDIDLALQSLSGSRALMMALPQLEAETEETEPEETIEETPEEMER